MNAREMRRTQRSLVNLHNYRVGREVRKPVLTVKCLVLVAPVLMLLPSQKVF